MSELMEKIGEFEWIVDFQSILPFLDEAYLGYDSEEFKNLKVLVIGCGTSNLSYSLFEQGFQNIVSIDNDAMCISFMKEKFLQTNSLQWIECDIVDEVDVENLIKKCGSKFDLIIDKGTLDAILVEGSIYSMLANLFHLLTPNGKYLLCSLHSQDFLSALLNLPSLKMSTSVYQTQPFSFQPATESSSSVPIRMTGTIAISQKVHTKKTKIQKKDEQIEELNDTKTEHQQKEIEPVNDEDEDSLDLIALAREEKEVTDHFYQEVTPLLSPEDEEKILLFYQSFPNETSSTHLTLTASSSLSSSSSSSSPLLLPSLPLEKIYHYVFVDLLSLSSDYSFELFQEDLISFREEERGQLSKEEKGAQEEEGEEEGEREGGREEEGAQLMTLTLNPNISFEELINFLKTKQ